MPSRPVRGWCLALSLISLAATDALARQDVPAELAPFEPLVGGWSGTATPAANPLKGWQEKHTWAWKFDAGKPVGLTFAFEKNPALAEGRVRFDKAADLYRLEGTDADGQAVRFAGKLDTSGRSLTFKKEPEQAGDPQITMKWFEDRPRYLLTVARLEKGATRAKKDVEVGLTRAGESLGRSDAASQPKCIITGGTATMSATYEGKTYPLCCTGCRDEFNENPAKYAAKAAKLGMDAPAAAAAEAKPAPAKPEAAPASAPKGKAEPPDQNVKVASLLRQAQALERAKRNSNALDFYRQIVKDHPDTPQAKSAAERIKALDK